MCFTSLTSIYYYYYYYSSLWFVILFSLPVASFGNFFTACGKLTLL